MGGEGRGAGEGGGEENVRTVRLNVTRTRQAQKTFDLVSFFPSRWPLCHESDMYDLVRSPVHNLPSFYRAYHLPPPNWDKGLIRTRRGNEIPLSSIRDFL